MLASYTLPGKPQGVTTFVDRRGERGKAATSAALGAFATGVDVLQMAFNRYDSFIEKLAILSERRHHEEGKWPQEFSFPLPRPLRWRVSEKN
jgi:hypothetical protein